MDDDGLQALAYQCELEQQELEELSKEENEYKFYLMESRYECSKI